ncbi:MAG: hypothetical protein KatS3mg103_0074 [Phycisphaerales bacterium]|nr:MAG: hypothetical protein KatS3mg103_0074 [Phycisphaerales bacterium]
MTELRFVLENERCFVPLADLLGAYALEQAQVERWIASGILPRPTTLQGQPAYEAEQLDRVTLAIRWIRHLGMDEAQLRVTIQAHAERRRL